jgi:TonB family protein
MAAVSKWQFRPGTKNGQVVAGPAQIEVNFRLLDKGSNGATRWHLARAEFHLPEGVSRPVCGKVVPPASAGDADTASATLTFEINQEGAPVNLRIEKASNEDWSRDVAAALSKWRFTPASQDGRTISVSCTMDFVRDKGE